MEEPEPDRTTMHATMALTLGLVMVFEATISPDWWQYGILSGLTLGASYLSYRGEKQALNAGETA